MRDLTDTDDMCCWQVIQSGIQQSKRTVTGFLFGARCNTELYVHGSAATSNDSQDKLKDELDRITDCLPGGAVLLSTDVLYSTLIDASLVTELM